MRDLRLVGAGEDASLVLADSEGTRFRLTVDGALRAAVRTERRGTPAASGPLSPREIQSRIRAGEDAEDVAESTGTPVERVRRYEGPVLAEREHVATQSRSGTVRSSGSAEGPAPRLGELVATRLSLDTSDVAALGWDAWRRDDGRWTVRVDYPHGGRDRTALWVYDPERRVVLPDDEDSRAFVEGVDPDRANVPQPEAPAEQQAPARVLHLARTPVSQDEAPDEDEIRTATAPSDATAEEPGPDEVDLTDRPSHDLAATPVAGRTLLDELLGDGDAREQPAAPAPQVPAATAETVGRRRPAARKPRAGSGRASVPSWDDIVFGSKPDSEA